MKNYLITNGHKYIYKEDHNYKTASNAALSDSFPYKKALYILNNSLPKSMKDYYLEEYETAEIIDIHKGQNVASNIIKNKNINFDESIIKNIIKEADSIMELFAFNQNELIESREIMNKALSFYDMAISDIRHIIKDNNPPAHKRTIIYGKGQELEQKRCDIKQTMKYLDVMVQAHTEKWCISRMQEELKRVKYAPYKGRTYVYDTIMELLS